MEPARAGPRFRSGLPVHLICAGADGRVCMEDVLCAGALARAIERGAGGAGLDDAAQIAAGAWDRIGPDPARLTEALRASRGGLNLARVGLG